MIKLLYFCENCREKIKEVSEIHFVEDNSDRGFCSEKCIMAFYKPYMLAMEKEEIKFRNSLGLNEEESYVDIIGSDNYLQTVLKKPSERWLIENELEQKFYTHILTVNHNSEELFFIILCSYIEGEPSFVFYRMATKSKELVEKYRRDNQVEVEDSSETKFDLDGDDLNISPEIIEMLEGKKSGILADMMINRSSADISIEEFTNYDSYLEETLETPDEIYEYEDREGDILNNFIKSFKLGEVPFFYIAIVYPYKIDSINEVAILPILSFPSIDQELYPKYAIGKKLNEVLKN